MHVFTCRSDDMVFEEQYNVLGRRIFPWPGVPEGPWGGAWVAVAPGDTSTPHAHDENEMFFILEGSGTLRIGDEERRVARGDTVFIPPMSEHALTSDPDGQLLFLTVWWDTPDRSAPVATGS